MRHLITATAIVLLTIGLLGAAPAIPLINPVGPAASNDRAATDPAIDPVLEQLDQVGSNLQAFSAKLKLTEIDNALGTSTERTGHVWYQKTPSGGARIHVLLDRRIDEGRQRAYAEKIEYLLEGDWLIDRNYQTKNEVKRQVLKPGQKLDLFKLGEGPFPLPIGQNPRAVHQAFDVRKIPPAKEDPPHAVHLELLPKPHTDLARKFHSIDVWVDEKTHMPVRVDTVDRKQQTTRSTELQNIVVNPAGGLPDSDFQLPNIDKQNWNRHIESLND